MKTLFFFFLCAPTPTTNYFVHAGPNDEFYIYLLCALLPTISSTLGPVVHTIATSAYRKEAKRVGFGQGAIISQSSVFSSIFRNGKVDNTAQAAATGGMG